MSCDTKNIKNYPTYEDLEKDKVFEKGWLPPIIPESAFAFNVESDLDTNSSNGYFSLLEVDKKKFFDNTISPVGGEKMKREYIDLDSKWIFYSEIGSLIVRFEMYPVK